MTTTHTPPEPISEERIDAVIREVHDRKSCLPDLVGMKDQWPEILRFARALIAERDAQWQARLDAVVEDVRVLREALAAGPTPGPWFVSTSGGSVYALHGCPGRNRFSALPQAGRRDDAPPEELAAVSRHIAACSPDRIARILNALEARNA